MMTRRRLSVALVVLVLLGTSWADAAAQRTAAEVAATRQRAEQGDAVAQYTLGFMYEVGTGVPQDSVEAVRWYRLAADQGHASAQVNLGVMYRTGQGVPEDDTEAVRWTRLAADQGHVTAQYLLGFMYDTGEGVPQDYAEAHKWHNLAASRASAENQTRYAATRDRQAKQMTPAQIAEAQRLAREWQAAFDARQE
ncbi:sel1 repeat family protein [bacterium AH-315-O15]|nr:sel1 repeat family protein [bacterium AH-315-O15]